MQNRLKPKTQKKKSQKTGRKKTKQVTKRKGKTRIKRKRHKLKGQRKGDFLSRKIVNWIREIR